MEETTKGSIIERLAYLEQDGTLAHANEFIDLFKEVVQGKATYSVDEARKLFDCACIQSGRWDAEWAYSPAQSPNTEAQYQAGKWNEISQIFYKVLIQAVQDPKMADLLDKKRSLISFEPSIKRAAQYSKEHPVEGFIMNIYTKLGAMLNSCGLKSLGRSFYIKGLWPRGAAGHPSNTSKQT